MDLFMSSKQDPKKDQKLCIPTDAVTVDGTTLKNLRFLCKIKDISE